MIRRFLSRITSIFRECGQSIAAYAIILAIVSIVGAGAIYSINQSTDDKMGAAGNRITNTNIGSEETYISLGDLLTMSVSIEDYFGAYDGESHTGSVTVTEPSSGYTISYGTMKGSYTLSSAPRYSDIGEYTVFFKVTANGYSSYENSFVVSISNRYVKIPSAYGSYVYDGSSHSATIVDYNSAYCTRTGTVTATNAGTYTVTFSLNDTEYSMWSDGTTEDKIFTWSIAKCAMSSVTVASVNDQNYTGSAITPEPAVSYNGSTLVKGTDFTYSYDNNTAPGIATIIITATNTGNFKGSTTKQFNIVAQTMTVTSSGYNGVYDGTAHAGTVNVSVPASGATVYYGSSSGGCNSTSPIYRTDVGTQTVYFKVTADNYNDYTGSFVITITKATISSVPTTATNWWYTGSAVTPTWTGFDSSKMTKGGSTSGTAIGSYTTSFTPTDNYQWSDGTSTAKFVIWNIVASTGTSYYDVTLNGQDRLGNAMSATYHLREDWNYSTNTSTVKVEYIRFNYYTSASNGYAQTSGGTGGDGSHNSWASYSTASIQVNSGTVNQMLYSAVNSTEFALPFGGSTYCYLTQNGSTWSSGNYSVTHDSNGNATVTLYGYWSWGTSATYPRDTRGGIHGGSSGTPASATIQLKDTKP